MPNFNRRQFIKSLSTATPVLRGIGAPAALSALAISGCSQVNTPNIIRMAVTGRPQMLDPRKATDALSSRVNRLLYRQLIDFDDSFSPIPDLAEWQQLSPTHYRFSTREQNRFIDGSPLTAEDIAATYLSVLNPEFGSAHRGSLKNIARIKVIDNLTVDFHLNEMDALFVGRLVIGILPKRLIEQNHPFHLEPFGSGACRCLSISEQSIVLERRIDKQQLVFIPVKDATVRVLKILKGEVDIVQNDLSPELVNYCQQQKQVKVKFSRGTNFGYIGFNFEDRLLSQLPMRQAIAHGINRQAVIDAMFKGHARLGEGLLVPEHWSGVQGLDDYEYNPSKAKALLKQVDIPAELIQKDKNNQPFIELSYKTSNDPTRIRLATIYQSQLKPLGIHLKIQSYDWGTFYNDIKKGRFQLYSLAWVGVKSPDIFQYVFASNAIPPKGANRGRYRDEVADALITRAAQSDSIAEQAELYRQLQTRLHEKLAAMPLWYEDQYAVLRKEISGYQLYADGRFDGLLQCQKKVTAQVNL
ncbi:ABC transporter substrate-binding protein [Thiomicrorhabdus sp. 6S2-11]|uniref:ABC transporter substrate-binding protein n=1 Tax=Thiomicrorhabdus marina TaxID=2818442 RepID=A0ABS3Q302_9GAMM|nr:ABC transporter substrate-binding protein [Thiomicrorhabdus marina]MBO1926713.1 ABC transporter substrate-binding protein [Thiomicrorhabdus marina]